MPQCVPPEKLALFPGGEPRRNRSIAACSRQLDVGEVRRPLESGESWLLLSTCEIGGEVFLTSEPVFLTNSLI